MAQRWPRGDRHQSRSKSRNRTRGLQIFGPHVSAGLDSQRQENARTLAGGQRDRGSSASAPDRPRRYSPRRQSQRPGAGSCKINERRTEKPGIRRPALSLTSTRQRQPGGSRKISTRVPRNHCEFPATSLWQKSGDLLQHVAKTVSDCPGEDTACFLTQATEEKPGTEIHQAPPPREIEPAAKVIHRV